MGIDILIGCEESGTVTEEFRKLGFNAWSCDLQPTSGNYPQYHIKGDIFEVLDNHPEIRLAIFHPTCTYITNSGVCWLFNKDGSRKEPRWSSLEDACKFFVRLMNYPIKYMALENPIPHKYALDLIGKKYDQLIQPYQFGHTESKATCLWLKNLPKLIETDNVKEVWKSLPKKESQRIHYLSPGPERAKLRSKTYKGIAEAIANQWSKLL